MTKDRRPFSPAGIPARDWDNGYVCMTPTLSQGGNFLPPPPPDTH